MTKAEIIQALADIGQDCTVYVSIYGQLIDIEDVEVFPAEEMVILDDKGSVTAAGHIDPEFAVLNPSQG